MRITRTLKQVVVTAMFLFLQAAKTWLFTLEMYEFELKIYF